MPRPGKNVLAFTDRSIQALKVEEGRVDFMDTRLEGFGVRVSANGRKAFFVRYRAGRQQRRYILGEYPRLSLKDAAGEAFQVLARVERGEDPQGERKAERQTETFADACELYLEHARRAKRRWQEDQRVITRDLLPAWRNRAVSGIQRKDVAAVLDRIVRRGAPIMANRTRALVSRIFSFLQEREIVIVNPVAGLKPPAEERSRERVLLEEEVRTLWSVWEAESSVTSAIFQMLLITGQREVEVMTMRWQDIDGPWWTVPAGVVKNKLAHRVYLSEPARALLARLQSFSGASEWVFPSPRKDNAHIASISVAKDRYRMVAGIHDWSPHDLRRTAATFMARVGISRFIISRVLNHIETGVTAIYDRSSHQADVQRALARWGDELTRILADAEPDNLRRIG